jgi:D-alanyl-D-alanine carboxypeptidase (penicillin-binding protein 5/6)
VQVGSGQRLRLAAGRVGLGVGLALLLGLGAAGRGRAADAAPAPAAPQAAAAALYDPAAQIVMVSRAGHARLPVASLVKLMTARLALEAGDPGRLVTVPAGVAELPETKVGLVPGERLPLGALVAGLLVHSGNDAALAIATALAGDEAAFADRMNAEAARLGLRDTHYVNASGLDAPGQYSSAEDVARLAAADLTLPGFAALVARPSVAMPDGRVYPSVNPFLAYYPGANGIKTGFTREAMFCLAASAERGGRTLIAVVLGEPSWAAADRDAAALLDWGFLQSRPVPVPPDGGNPLAPPGAGQQAAPPPTGRPPVAPPAAAEGAIGPETPAVRASPAPAAYRLVRAGLLGLGVLVLAASGWRLRRGR